MRRGHAARRRFSTHMASFRLNGDPEGGCVRTVMQGSGDDSPAQADVTR